MRRFTALVLLVVPVSLAAQRGGALAGETASLPEPRTSFEGRVLDFDFPGLLIGSAEYDEGPTGVTVFYFPAGAMATVDVRGGAPGTVNTDALRLGYESPQMRAIVFAGGSWHGLAAVTGVADDIRALRMEGGEAPRVVGAAGAIINDIGPVASMRRFSAVTPDARLGAAALRASRPGRFPLGARGAGRFAMAGVALGEAEFSGQGAAFRQLGSTKIAVFTVANPGGLVVDRGGRVARCRSMRWRGSCGTISDVLAERVARIAATAMDDTGAAPPPPPNGPSDNTTITLVVTNQKLDWWALQRLATQVHTSMARAIQTFAGVADGDVLYAATTSEVDNPRLPLPALALAASELAWDAVLSSVPPPDAPDDTTAITIAAEALDRYTGEYDLGPGSIMSVRRDGARLVAESAHGGQYLPAGGPVGLLPVEKDEFLLETQRRDRVRFDPDGTGRITGLTLNPGQWALTARRATLKR